MSKRKRDTYDGDDSARDVVEDRALRIRKDRLKAKVEQGTKLLHQGLKLARGFERQKLGRRQKTAASNKSDDQATRLKAEIAALKSLDLEVTAQKHIHRHLVKTKRIRESPAFVALHSENVHIEGPKNPAEANVTARLFKSAPVKQAMTGIMSGIYGCLGLEEYPSLDARDMQQKESPEPRRSNPTIRAENNGPHGRPEPMRKVAQANGVDAVDGRDEMNDSELEAYDIRIATSSDSSSESDSAESSNHVHVHRNRNEVTYDPAADLSLSPSVISSPSESPPPKAADAKAKANSEPKPKSTTFLPSLTMGGYWSGSELGDDYMDNVAQLMVVKNRKGQRERRMIAEKKYGAKANHLKKQGRDHGWDLKRGATGGDSRGGRRNGRGNVNNGGRGASTGANSEPMQMKPPKASSEQERPLHPSWEAARKLKEQKPQTFQGKKVVFD